MDGNEKALHNREAFQLERVILFTDAVFAIAITLLVIEIKVPELEHRNEEAALHGLAQQLARFIGFFLSFFIIAVYWMAHHRIFRFVTHTTPRLLWLNMLFLLSIVLMPFTTAFQSEYAMLRLPWVLYSLNILFSGLMQYGLQVYLRNPAAAVVRPAEQQHPDLDPVRPLVSPLIFLLSIALALIPGVHASLLRPLPLLLFPAFWLYQRRFRRLSRAFHRPQVAPAPEPEPAAVAEAAPVPAPVPQQ
jgi:uncharacterized membrane protein